MVTKVDGVPAISLKHCLLPSTDDLFELGQLEGTRLHWVGSVAAVEIVPVISVSAKRANVIVPLLTFQTGTPFAIRLFEYIGSILWGRG